MNLPKLAKLSIPAIVGAVVLLGTAAAAITLSYNNTSSPTLVAKAVPVIYEAGADSAISDYVTVYSISTNKTFFASTVAGVPEATVVIGNLVQLRNVDTRVHTVTLSAPQSANANVQTYKVDFFDGATNVGTLDFKVASPSVTFASMAAGKVYTAKVTVSLAAGAGANNVNDLLALTTAVSS